MYDVSSTNQTKPDINKGFRQPKLIALETVSKYYEKKFLLNRSKLEITLICSLPSIRERSHDDVCE